MGRKYVRPYATAMSHGCTALGFQSSAAIREPRASPSKVSNYSSQCGIRA